MDTSEDEDIPEPVSNFDLCIICQKKSTEKCIDPSLNNDPKVLGQGFSSFAMQLKEFHQIGALKCPRLQKMTVDHGDNLDTHMRLMAVKWHKTCKLKYNKSRLSREKAKSSAEHNNEEKEIDSDELSNMIQWIQ